MNTEDVWALVDWARRDLPSDADADAVAARMVALLSRRESTDIVAFAQPLWDLLVVSYRADLWAAAYIINGGASDDGFDYFRGWLVAQGRKVFEQALADPDSLADVPAVLAALAEGDDLSCEDMLGVAWDAYEQKTGDELPDDAYTIDYPELDPAWAFDFDDEGEMRRRLPRLAALYYEDADED